ncbi:MAG TPA: magnesium transporter CorA family protein [Elusimicrobiota bacterium]|nr:magnesium transporter CorA family protein [Elusimicrobiota bacterium]
MLKKLQIVGGKLVENGGDRPCVLVFVKPDDKERQQLLTDYHIDEHTLASAMDPDEPSRIEIETDYLAVIFKHPKNYSERETLLFKVASMGLFLYKEQLVIVFPDDIPLFTGKIFNSLENVNDIFLRVIYRSIYHFMEHLKVINMITDEIEHKISVSMENKYLLNLFSLEKSLVYYLSAINSNEFVFEKLRNNGPKFGFSPKNMELLEDITIENSQCYRQAEIYSNILASLMDARASIVSNNLNILMKTLNFITIAIMVPTFVVSAFSMNVRIPWEQHPQAFWIVMVLAVLSELGVMFWWQRATRFLHKKGRE